MMDQPLSLPQGCVVGPWVATKDVTGVGETEEGSYLRDERTDWSTQLGFGGTNRFLCTLKTAVKCNEAFSNFLKNTQREHIGRAR